MLIPSNPKKPTARRSRDDGSGIGAVVVGDAITLGTNVFPYSELLRKWTSISSS